jgi:S1-C subfamily serine protease
MKTYRFVNRTSLAAAVLCGTMFSLLDFPGLYAAEKGKMIRASASESKGKLPTREGYPIQKATWTSMIAGRSVAVVDDELAVFEPILTAGSANWNDVYQKVAPAVLFVRTENGFGTGMLLDKEGWALTNHHVAVDGYTTDDQNVKVEVQIGILDDDTGFMKKMDVVIPALVYKWNQEKDIALIKLDVSSLSGVAQRVFDAAEPLQFRSRSAALGVLEEVILVGNAGSGFLWSAKKGEVSQVGRDSTTAADIRRAQLLARQLLDLGETQLPNGAPIGEDSIREFVSAEEDRTLVIEATAQAAQGDSGGPLVDTGGKVVGMCRSSSLSSGDDTPRYYYIHFSELIDFFGSKPEQPLQNFTTDFWEFSDLVSDWDLIDIDDDDKHDTLVGLDEDRDIIFVAQDLDQDTSWDDLDYVSDLIDAKSFDAEFVWVADWVSLKFQTLYDRDNDGTFEELRLNNDFQGQSVSIVSLQAGAGHYKVNSGSSNSALIADEFLVQGRASERYETLVPQIVEITKGYIDLYQEVKESMANIEE